MMSNYYEIERDVKSHHKAIDSIHSADFIIAKMPLLEDAAFYTGYAHAVQKQIYFYVILDEVGLDDVSEMYMPEYVKSANSGNKLYTSIEDILASLEPKTNEEEHD